MTKALRVLLVEDSDDDAQVLLNRLRREGIEVESLRVDTADAMLAALRDRTWDAVLSDYSMPAFSANAARALLSESGLDIPFIIVSGTIGEDTAVNALKSGAHDFLRKGNLNRLLPAIERGMRDAEERRKRRAAERVLSETRERMQFALEAAGVGTWESEITSGKTVWSDVLERLHGLPAGSFGGTFEAFIEAIHPDDRDRVRNQIARSLADRTDFRVEYRAKWPDGSIHWLIAMGRTFYAAAGQPQRSAGIGIDITERKLLEEQFIQAQKMESVGNLAGGIAHDFNNLLTAIAGYCQLLKERPGLEPDVLSDLGEISQAVDRAAALTSQLLAFSRRQLLAPKVVSLNDIIGNLSAMLRRLIEENVQLEFHLSADLARVNVDPGQIEQVLMNLVVNARDAMLEGGTITVATTNVVLDADSIWPHVRVPPGQYVLLSVSDTGQGIAPEVRRRLFEPFFTTKPKGQGTGLGLATVYGIVKQSGGYIFVYSEPGMGAAFKLYFPAASGEPSVEAATARAATGDLTGAETILVVEDEARLRTLEERILRRYGYRVLVATNAADAIRICSEYDGPIHVALTDVVMPGGSGRTLGTWIAEHRRETRVVYMSGYTGDAIAHHGVLESGIRFLQKPFSPDALARTIREALS